MNTFTFSSRPESSKNISSYYGIRIATAPTEHNGSPTFEEYDIPGRTTKMTRYIGQWEPSTREYNVSFPAVGSTEAARLAYLESNLRDIKFWLMASTKWTRLTDTYDTTIYRLARCLEDMEFTRFRDDVYQGTIKFTLDPRKFLNSGDTFYSVSNNGGITNPGMVSEPILTFTCSSANARIAVNTNIDGYTKQYVINIPNASGVSFEIDCENMSIYRVSAGVYYPGGAYVARMSEFPKLGLGTSIFNLTGVSNFKVKPRWWQP